MLKQVKNKRRLLTDFVLVIIVLVISVDLWVKIMAILFISYDAYTSSQKDSSNDGTSEKKDKDKKDDDDDFDDDDDDKD